MSNESENHSTRDELGSDCGSPVDSEDDGRLSPRSRKCPAGSRWSFTAIFIVETTDNSLSSDEVASNSAGILNQNVKFIVNQNVKFIP